MDKKSDYHIFWDNLSKQTIKILPNIRIRIFNKISEDVYFKWFEEKLFLSPNIQKDYHTIHNLNIKITYNYVIFTLREPNKEPVFANIYGGYWISGKPSKPYTLCSIPDPKTLTNAYKNNPIITVQKLMNITGTSKQNAQELIKLAGQLK